MSSFVRVDTEDGEVTVERCDCGVLEPDNNPLHVPHRVQLRRAKGWRMPPGTKKVDRTTIFGNPFVVGKDGTAARCVELFRHLMAGKVCLTSGNIEAQERCYYAVKASLSAMRGLNLACWCRAGQPCHADVLLEVFNGSALHPNSNPAEKA